MQAALPDILRETPKSFYAETLEFIESNAQLFFKKISAIPGLKPVMPQGAMYMMVRYAFNIARYSCNIFVSSMSFPF